MRTERHRFVRIRDKIRLPIIINKMTWVLFKEVGLIALNLPHCKIVWLIWITRFTSDNAIHMQTQRHLHTHCMCWLVQHLCVHIGAQEAAHPACCCTRLWALWTSTRATSRSRRRDTPCTRRCCARARLTTRTRVRATAAARWPARQAALRTLRASCRGASAAREASRQPTRTWARSPTPSKRPSPTV